MRQHQHKRGSAPPRRRGRRLLAVAAMVTVVGGVAAGTSLANADVGRPACVLAPPGSSYDPCAVELVMWESQVPHLVNQAYAQVLGRAPDPTGFAFFSGQLLNGTMTYDMMVQALMNSDEYRAKTGR